MKRLNWIASLVLAVLIAVVAGGSATAQGPASPVADGDNLMITITVGDVEADNKSSVRSYKLVALDGGNRAEMLMGWRMPIPTTRAVPDTPDSQPVTSFTYQNIGVTASIEVDSLADGRILLAGSIEISGVREQKGEAADTDAPPLIGTFQQSVFVIVKEGEAMRVAEVPDPDGGSLYVQLTVDRLD